MKRKEIKKKKFWTDALYDFEFKLSSYFMVIMVVDISIQVIARYIFRHSLTGSEELGRYCFILMTFYGAALGIKKDKHASLDTFVKKFPFKIAKITKIFALLSMTVLVIVSLIGFIVLMEISIRQKSAALQIPMIVMYILTFIGVFTMLIFSTEKLIEAFNLKEGK